MGTIRGDRGTEMVNFMLCVFYHNKTLKERERQDGRQRGRGGRVEEKAWAGASCRPWASRAAHGSSLLKDTVRGCHTLCSLCGSSAHVTHPAAGPALLTW